jgi:DNA polymerase elongation subunit (family B)
MTEQTTNAHHGKIIKYSRSGTTEERQAALRALPNRKEFLHEGHTRFLRNSLKKGAPVYFLPNDLVEQHYKTPNGYGGTSLKYKLILFGVLFNGSKAALIIEGIDLFFDVKVPDGVPKESFGSDVQNLLKANGCFPTRYGFTSKLPFEGFQKSKSDYVRLHFNTSWQRTRSIKYLRDNPYVYSTNTGTRMTVNLETASDDLSSHYRKVAREYKIDLCDWNQVSEYKIDTSGEYVNHRNVEHAFVVDIKNMRSMSSDPALLKKKQSLSYLRQDRSMIATWDIETYSNRSTGNAPDPAKIFDESGREADLMFMDCMTFGWHSEDNPFLRICISEMPVPPRDDCLIIQCDNQVSMAQIKGHILGRMAPEFVSGFNDGQYDWPFLINRMKTYDEMERHIGSSRVKSAQTQTRANVPYRIMSTFKRAASCLAYTEENAKYAIKGEHNESKIKIDADTYVDATFFRVPGYIPIDVRIVFRRLMPNAEKSSLNFFLSVCKLGSKEDMPYQTMFKIYRLLRDFARDAKTTDYAKIMEYIEDRRGEYGDEYVWYNRANVRERCAAGVSDNPFKQVDDSTYGAEKLTLEEIIHVLKEATDVVKYCNVDAQRCHELLKIRNVVPDHREMANLSYTSMDDAVYKADGMKVRNLVISRGIEKEWDIAFTNISSGIKDPRKYPGAYVVPPKKGLYRDHVTAKRKRVQVKTEPVNTRADAARKVLRGIDGRMIRTFDHKYIDPQEPEFAPLRDWWFSEGKAATTRASSSVRVTARDIHARIEHVKNTPVDENDEIDRPCTGLDFSSLYPSEIMTFNLSPEKLIRDEAYARALEAEGYRLKKVSVPYFKDGEPVETREIRVGWIVQHTPIKDDKGNIIRYDGMGLYPTILKELFDLRSEFKNRMGYFEEPKEFMEKVFESKSLDALAELPIDEQQKYVVEFAEQFIADLQDSYDNAVAVGESVKAKFYKWKLHGANEVLAFFHKEWISEGSGLVRGKGMRAVYEEINFQFTYWNSKQLALKRFMNTFYGETGNSLSPFFAVEIAGGITTNGQESIKLVKKFVESKGYRVLYGDTDSLYICCPEHIFEDLDDAFLNGKISKAEYWKRMIELTMEDLDKFKNEVNNMLYEDNGTRFLKMAYEEVLWPFAMVGKKKYIGVQHMGIVNLAICMPECTLSEFMKSKTLFIRGLEIKKRGGSEFMKINCYKVWKDAFCITETRTLREIVECNLQDIMNHEWKPEMFARTKRYKLPDPGKPGNVSVLKLISRMRYIEENHPELGIKCPEAGERFPIIYAKKYPWKYGITGTKVEKSMGEKMEFFESLTNTVYNDWLEREEGACMEIDMDYYMTGEICGQFARFLLYHSAYDHHFQDWMYEDDEAYKSADKKAHGEAKKILVKYYEEHFGSVYPEFGTVQKGIYAKIRSKAKTDRIYSYHGGDTTLDILDKLESVAFHNSNIEDSVEGGFGYKKSSDEVSTKLANKMIGDAKKLGESRAETLAPYIAEALHMSLTEYMAHYYIPKLHRNPMTGTRVKTCMKNERLHRAQTDLRTLQRKMKLLMVKYKSISEDDMNSFGEVVNTIIRENKISVAFGKPIAQGCMDAKRIKEQVKAMQEQITSRLDLNILEEEEFIDEDEKVYLIEKIEECYYDLAATYKKIKELELNENYLKDNARLSRLLDSKSRQRAKRQMIRPSAVTDTSEANEFRNWMKNKSDALSDLPRI